MAKVIAEAEAIIRAKNVELAGYPKTALAETITIIVARIVNSKK